MFFPSSWVWASFPFAEGTHWGMGGAKGKETHYNESFHLPYKIDLSEAQSAMIYRGRAEFDRWGTGGTPLPWESEGGWASTPRGGAWGKAPFESPLRSWLRLRIS